MLTRPKVTKLETETLYLQDRDETETRQKRLETASRPRRSRPRLHPCCGVLQSVTDNALYVYVYIAYHMTVQQNSMMRLMSTVRRPSSSDDPSPRDVNVKYVINRRCQCPTLTTGAICLLLLLILLTAGLEGKGVASPVRGSWKFICLRRQR